MDNKISILISGEYNAFKEGFNAAGVYMASGIYPSSTFERPIYIGSSESLRDRISYSHLPRLSDNTHENKPMQNYYNKHGEKCLIWYLVEITSKDNNLIREQYYLDIERPFCDEKRGFNIAKDTFNPMKGRPVSEETRKKLSLGQMGSKNHRFGKKNSEAVKRASSIANKGKIRSPESIEKGASKIRGRKRPDAGRTREEMIEFGKMRLKNYSFLSPNNEITIGINLREFANKHGLCEAHLSSVLSGRRKHHRGYTRYIPAEST